MTRHPSTSMTIETEALSASVLAAMRQALARQLEPGLHIVATPIGRLTDITLEAIVTLARAHRIYCEDTRVSRVLLAHYGIDQPLASYHEHNAERVRPEILSMLAEGHAIALISDAGTPLVSDPGYKLVTAALAAGAHVFAAPGPSALLAALVSSGLPSDTFLFAGFLPSKAGQRAARLKELAGVPATLIFYESAGRLTDTLTSIAEHLGDREAAVARELTKRHEEVLKGTLKEINAAFTSQRARGEIVIVVAPPESKSCEDISDDTIREALSALLEHEKLSTAARSLAERLGVSRARIYDIGLALKDARAQDNEE